MPSEAPAGILGQGGALTHLLLVVEQTVMVRAWHLHVQGPQQPGLLEVALFPERPIWPSVYWIHTGLVSKAAEPGTGWGAGKNRGSIGAHPTSYCPKTGQCHVQGLESFWTKVFSPRTRNRLFLREASEQNLPASIIHMTPSKFLPNPCPTCI